MISFLHSYFLFGLAGVAVPLLIHFLTRDRIQRAVFPTLRFFAKGAKAVVRRKKFQEWLLMALRAALVALLALVFARPYWKSKRPVIAGTDAVSTARVVMVDVSASMRRPGLPGALKKEVSGALDSLKQGNDKAALVTFDDAPVLREPLSGDLAQIRSSAEALEPGYGGTNLVAALRKANDLLRGIPAKNKEVVLISDFPRQSWRSFKGDWKLAADVSLKLRPLKPTGALRGVAIVEASAPSSLVLDGQPSFIATRIANFSDEPLNGLEVGLQLNHQKADAQRVNIRPHGTVGVRFRHVFDTPGDNPGVISVGGDASPETGTLFYFNARTLPRIPVLLINGHPSADPQTDPAFFIRKALAPVAESPFAVNVLAAEKVTPEEVAKSKVVILADVGTLPGAVTEALSALVQRGGGLLFFPGSEVKAEAFNAAFGSIAPYKLRQVLAAHPANGETAESLTRIDFEHPIFEVFAQPHHGDLTLPKFAKYWETSDTQLSRVLARFGDERPAMLEREIGRGLSIAWAGAIETGWTDFAQHAVFLPCLHQMVRHLAIKGGQKTAYACGETLPLAPEAMLKDPEGKVHPATEAIATKPGFYQSMAKSGQPDFCYAVNGSLAESDPATIAPDEIAAAIERAPGEILPGGDSGAALSITGEPDGKDRTVWWTLLCALIALGMAELIVSNKTLRH